MNTATRESAPAWAQELQDRLAILTDAVIQMTASGGQRLTRSQLCARMGIHRNTLRTRMERPGFPTPDENGRWLLSEIIEWETTH